MNLESPLTTLHEAISAAVHRDLPVFTYEDRDWDAWLKLSTEDKDHAMKTDSVPRIRKTRRPESYEVEVVMFPQTWGSTALGYGGMGGAAMTPAYTVIVKHRNSSCVYFGGGRLAYRLDHSTMSNEGRANMLGDISCHSMVEVHKSDRYQ